MTECFCDINEAWRRVREARTYQGVIDRANEWLPLMWPKARLLGVNKVSLAEIPVPYIRVDYTMKAAGSWHYPSIAVGSQANLAKHNAEIDHARKVDGLAPLPPLRDELRQVILHETRHALDDPLGELQPSYKTADPLEMLKADHPPAFIRRLHKLERLFPFEGA